MGQASSKENQHTFRSKDAIQPPHDVKWGLEMRDTTAIHSLALLVIPACCHSGRGEKRGFNLGLFTRARARTRSIMLSTKK